MLLFVLEFFVFTIVVRASKVRKEHEVLVSVVRLGLPRTVSTSVAFGTRLVFPGTYSHSSQSLDLEDDWLVSRGNIRGCTWPMVHGRYCLSLVRHLRKVAQ